MGSSKKQTIGYKYYMGMHMVICHGPVDELQSIEVGDREAWNGQRYTEGYAFEGWLNIPKFTPSGSPTPVTANEQIIINAPDLFGGPKKEGGVQGKVDIMMGGPTQGANDYLVSKLGTPMPGFRGVLSVVLRQVYLTAMTPYPKPWAFRIKRIPAKTWYAAKADINNGSANPIHVIYETLTNPDWGMGYPPGALDDAAFRAAADTCFAEGLGVSMIMTKQDAIESFIYQVLGHCNGMMYTRPDNGQFAIKLLREDYVLASQPLFDESNIVRLESFERPGYAEITNEIVVVYRPRGSKDDDSVTVQDLAAIQAQQGIVSQTVQYPGIDNATNAAKLAMRDLRQKSTPLARIRIIVNRNAWNLKLGEVFRFSWAEHGLVELAMRVMSINYGDLAGGEITIVAAEDVFGLPSSTYVGNQPPLWTDPVGAPQPLALRLREEVPYWDLAQTLAPADLASLDLTTTFASMVGGVASTYIQNYELWTAVGTVAYDLAATGDLAPHAILGASIGPTATSISVNTMTSGVDPGLLNRYLIIDSEFMRIDSINTLTGILGVGRGCLDTVPANHTAGGRVWFADDHRAVDPTEYASGTTVKMKARTRTGQGLLDLSLAPEETLAVSGRQAKPYPPGDFRLIGLRYPTQANGAMTVNASHRNRKQQLVYPIIDTLAGNIGPEAGTTYTIDIYAADGVTLKRTQAGITTFPWAWDNEETQNTGTGTGRNRVVLKAVRDGLNSYQSHDWYIDRAGVGNNLGTFLGGV